MNISNPLTSVWVSEETECCGPHQGRSNITTLPPVAALSHHKHGFPISSQAADMFSVGLLQTRGPELNALHRTQSCNGCWYFTVGQSEPDFQHK